MSNDGIIFLEACMSQIDNFAAFMFLTHTLCIHISKQSLVGWNIYRNFPQICNQCFVRFP